MKTKKSLQFRQLNAPWTQHAKDKIAIWNWFRHWYHRLYHQLPRNVYKCKFPMTNDLPSQEENLTKSRSALLDCISELCSATDIPVATVHENFTSQHQIGALKFGRMQRVKFTAWNKWKIWKLKQYEITATLRPHNTL